MEKGSDPKTSKIPREETRWLILVIVAISIIKCHTQHDKLRYDTGEWIPVTPSSAPRATLEQQKVNTEADDRVLNIEIPQVQKFFPDREYESMKNAPRPQHRQYLSENVYNHIPENAKPRKLNFQSGYKFNSRPTPPGAQIELNNQDAVQQYWELDEKPSPVTSINVNDNNRYEKTILRIPEPNQSVAPNYYVSQQQMTNQRPVIPQRNQFLGAPNLNPQVPAVDAPNIYEHYNIPFNRSFYESLNPTFINNDFYAAVNKTPQSSSTLQSTGEREGVQLVYVPVENLSHGKLPSQNPSSSETNQKTEKTNLNAAGNQLERFLYKPKYSSSNEQIGSQSIYNNLNSQSDVEFPLFSQVSLEEQKLTDIQEDYRQQSLQATKLQQQFRVKTVPNIITTTPIAPKSDKKRKPHQPPLAVYLSETEADISEVLDLLKNAKSISVQDTVSPNSPKIFVGPSNLKSPNGYSKFPLPYLNNVNGKRINPKIEQLPFFVAPLNYKAPLGYSKIPLPSPHVGSVVVSTTNEAAATTKQSNAYQGQYENDQPYRTRYENTFPSTSTTPSSYFAEQSTIPPARSTLQTTEPIYIEPTQGQSFDVEAKLTEPNLNPLELAINEFELDQINNKLRMQNEFVGHDNDRPGNIRGQSKFEQSTTPSTRSRARNQENRSTTARPQSRRRGKPRQDIRLSSTTSTTPDLHSQRFTVLEEFQSGRLTDEEKDPPTTPLEKSKYSNIENINDYIHAERPIPSSPNESNPTKLFSQYLLENVNNYRNTLETTTHRKPNSSPYENEDFHENNNGQQFVTSDGIRYSVPSFDIYTKGPETQFTYQYDQISALNSKQAQLENNGQQIFEAIYESPSGFSTDKPGIISEEKFEAQTTPYEHSGNIRQSEEMDNTFINPLQDTAVRSLLQTNLLAPSTKHRAGSTQEETSRHSTKGFLDTTPSSTEVEASTVRTRGKVRGRRPTTSAPNRAAGRRRPTRPTTERMDIESYSLEGVDNKKSNTKQRFRTRARPAHTIVSEDSSTKEKEFSEVNEPVVEFESTYNKQPQSFMQFDAHISDEQSIETGKLNSKDETMKEYQQPNSNTPDSVPRQFAIAYENTSPSRASTATSLQDSGTQPGIQTILGTVTVNNNEDQIEYQNTYRSETQSTTEKTPTRLTIRSRTRGRSRFTTTTSRPSSRSSTHRTSTSSDKNSESNVQFVGEIRPKYSNRKSTTSTPETGTQTPRPRIRSRVRASGRTRTSPKPLTTDTNDSDGTEQITRKSSVVRTRNRGSSHYRPPLNNKRDNIEDADITKQNYPKDFLQKLETKSKTTMTTHNSEKALELDNDDDQYLHASINHPRILPVPEGLSERSDLNQLPTSDKSHQITLTAAKSETSDEAQIKFSDQDIVTNTVPNIVTDRSDEIFRGLTRIEEDILLNLEKTKKNIAVKGESELETSESSTAINTNDNDKQTKSRRKGAWRIVKHRIADPLETAESQNYQSVINAFQSIEKISPHSKSFAYDEKSTEAIEETTILTTTNASTERERANPSAEGTSNKSIFDTIYQMFGVLKPERSDSNANPTSTTTIEPTFAQEISEETTKLDLPITNNFLDNDEAKSEPIVTTESVLSTDTVTLSKPFEVEPWEMKEVKTSTSTEISHETEICYKGKCVKAKNMKKMATP